MEILNWCIDAILLMIHVVLSLAPPLVGLTWLAALAGIAMLWVFGKTSNQRRMRQVKRRIQAGLLELRLFVDEPAVSMRAQKGLLAANLSYLALALRPALLLAIPIGLLLVHLEAFYERAPLPLAEPAVVTMQMSADWDPSSAAPELLAPAGIAVLGPPVRVAATREVSWRIVPYSPGARMLRFQFNGREVSKWVVAGGRQGYVPGRSVRSAWASILSPGEGRIHSDFADWVEVRYAGSALGPRVNWLVWFLAVSMAAGLVVKKRLRVVI